LGDDHASEELFTATTEPETPDPAASPWYTVQELITAVIEMCAAPPIPGQIIMIDEFVASNPMSNTIGSDRRCCRALIA
jgi:hypothetical protein